MPGINSSIGNNSPSRKVDIDSLDFSDEDFVLNRLNTSSPVHEEDETVYVIDEETGNILEPFNYDEENDDGAGLTPLRQRRFSHISHPSTPEPFLSPSRRANECALAEEFMKALLGYQPDQAKNPNLKPVNEPAPRRPAHPLIQGPLHPIAPTQVSPTTLPAPTVRPTPQQHRRPDLIIQGPLHPTIPIPTQVSPTTPPAPITPSSPAPAAQPTTLPPPLPRRPIHPLAQPPAPPPSSTPITSPASPPTLTIPSSSSAPTVAPAPAPNPALLPISLINAADAEIIQLNNALYFIGHPERLASHWQEAQNLLGNLLKIQRTRQAELSQIAAQKNPSAEIKAQKNDLKKSLNALDLIIKDFQKILIEKSGELKKPLIIIAQKNNQHIDEIRFDIKPPHKSLNSQDRSRTAIQQHNTLQNQLDALRKTPRQTLEDQRNKTKGDQYIKSGIAQGNKFNSEIPDHLLLKRSSIEITQQIATAVQRNQLRADIPLRSCVHQFVEAVHVYCEFCLYSNEMPQKVEIRNSLHSFYKQIVQRLLKENSSLSLNDYFDLFYEMYDAYNHLRSSYGPQDESIQKEQLDLFLEIQKNIFDRIPNTIEITEEEKQNIKQILEGKTELTSKDQEIIARNLATPLALADRIFNILAFTQNTQEIAGRNLAKMRQKGILTPKDKEKISRNLYPQMHFTDWEILNVLLAQNELSSENKQALKRILKVEAITSKKPGVLKQLLHMLEINTMTFEDAVEQLLHMLETNTMTFEDAVAIEQVLDQTEITHLDKQLIKRNLKPNISNEDLNLLDPILSEFTDISANDRAVIRRNLDRSPLPGDQEEQAAIAQDRAKAEQILSKDRINSEEKTIILRNLKVNITAEDKRALNRFLEEHPAADQGNSIAKISDQDKAVIERNLIQGISVRDRRTLYPLLQLTERYLSADQDKLTTEISDENKAIIRKNLIQDIPEEDAKILYRILQQQTEITAEHKAVIERNLKENMLVSKDRDRLKSIFQNKLDFSLGLHATMFNNLVRMHRQFCSHLPENAPAIQQQRELLESVQAKIIERAIDEHQVVQIDSFITDTEHLRSQEEQIISLPEEHTIFQEWKNEVRNLRHALKDLQDLAADNGTDFLEYTKRLGTTLVLIGLPVLSSHATQIGANLIASTVPNEIMPTLPTAQIGIDLIASMVPGEAGRAVMDIIISAIPAPEQLLFNGMVATLRDSLPKVASTPIGQTLTNIAPKMATNVVRKGLQVLSDYTPTVYSTAFLVTLAAVLTLKSGSSIRRPKSSTISYTGPRAWNFVKKVGKITGAATAAIGGGLGAAYAGGHIDGTAISNGIDLVSNTTATISDGLGLVSNAPSAISNGISSSIGFVSNTTAAISGGISNTTAATVSAVSHGISSSIGFVSNTTQVISAVASATIPVAKEIASALSDNIVVNHPLTSAAVGTATVAALVGIQVLRNRKKQEDAAVIAPVGSDQPVPQPQAVSDNGQPAVVDNVQGVDPVSSADVQTKRRKPKRRQLADPAFLVFENLRRPNKKASAAADNVQAVDVSAPQPQIVANNAQTVSLIGSAVRATAALVNEQIPTREELKTAAKIPGFIGEGIIDLVKESVVEPLRAVTPSRAVVQQTASLAGSAVQGTASLTGSAIRGTASLAGSAVQGTASLAGSAIRRTASLAGSAVQGTASLISEEFPTGEEVMEAVATTTQIPGLIGEGIVDLVKESTIEPLRAAYNAMPSLGSLLNWGRTPAPAPQAPQSAKAPAPAPRSSSPRRQPVQGRARNPRTSQVSSGKKK